MVINFPQQFCPAVFAKKGMPGALSLVEGALVRHDSDR